MNEKIDVIVKNLDKIDGVAAIVLGGSHATKTNRPDSDVDLGIYYSNENLLNIDQVKKLAFKINDTNEPVVTELGTWGDWVNGGAWLTVRNQRVDFIYRDLEFVSQIIDECTAGKIRKDYYQQPPYGFYSYIYLAETYYCKVLYDPQGHIAKLKKKVQKYPRKLKETVINEFLWSAEFSLIHAEKAAKRGDVYFVSGCITRIINSFVQTLYALNEIHFISEKKYPNDEPHFKIKPNNFAARTSLILAAIGDTTEDLMFTYKVTKDMFDEMIDISQGIYTPKFNLL